MWGHVVYICCLDMQGFVLLTEIVGLFICLIIYAALWSCDGKPMQGPGNGWDLATSISASWATIFM